MGTAKELTPLTIGETLDGAADWLEKHGWCQGYGAWPSLEHPEEACLFGSVMIALGGLKANGAVYFACRHKLKSEGYDTAWNDEPSRTKEEVIKALRSTAEKCIGDTDE